LSRRDRGRQNRPDGAEIVAAVGRYDGERMFVRSGHTVLDPLPHRRRPGDPTTLEGLAGRVRPTAASRTRLLPVPEPMVGLLPDGGLRRGSVVSCGGAGAVSLALALVGAASAAGSWCAVVGVDDVGVLAASGYGLDLRRLAVVRTSPAQWAAAVGLLLDGVDLVVVRPPDRPRSSAVRQLVARARDRRAVLVVLADRARWPEPSDVDLRVTTTRWRGLDRGAGHLRDRRATVVAQGRGSAVRPVRRHLWLPSASGQVAGV